MRGLEWQLAVLGTGEHWIEAELEALAAALPGRVSVTLGYDEALAHQIEAGADAYIIKSRFDQNNLLETIEQLI